MRKLKRKKIVKEFLENRIEKNQRRIQRLANENFLYRQQLIVLIAAEEKAKAKPEDKPAEAATVDAAKHEAVIDSADQEIGNSI